MPDAQKIFGGRLFVLAELAQSYEGCFDDALALVDAAAVSGADGVKFQVFSADELAVPGYEHYDLYKRLEFPEVTWKALFDRAHAAGLRVCADVFGHDGVAMLDRLEVDAFKMHAADMRNLSLLRALGHTGRPVIVSCGGSTAGEIAEAVGVLSDAGAPELCLMHGFQASPTTVKDTSFGRITALRRTFGLPVGYADHIDGSHPLAVHWPLIAVGAGANVIEKHLTLCRADQKEDYISALNPDEFAAMSANLRLAEAGIGRADFDLTAAETAYRDGFRKRVVAARPIAKGALISIDDITLKRAPGQGLSDVDAVVGRTAAAAITRGSPISQAALVLEAARPRVVATLACRSTSSRLYAKPLQRLGDRSVVEHLIARIQSVPRVDQIVLAISEGIENEPYIDLARRLGLEYVIGDEHDVQERLILAGEKGRADLLLRATTESPFLYTDNIDEMVERHVADGAALTVTEGLPDGCYGEIISLDALKDAHARGERRHRSELCTLYMFEHPDRYKTLRLQAPAPLRRKDIRLTIDYPEDLIVCREVAEALGAAGPLFSLAAIIEYLDANPRLNALNSSIDSGTGRIWA